MYDSTKWKLVPVDPTDAMIQAGIDAPLANTGDDAIDQPQDYRNVYGAMVGEAPDPVPPIIQTLHANGDRIAMEATIAQQAQRIADLEATPVVERQDGSALMKIAADLANRNPLRQLYRVCEHQGRINTDSLHEHLDKCGDLLAGIALDIRRAIAEQPAPVALTIPEECPHLIMFDDTERENLLFSGAGARSAALKTWEQISMSWNAHLFVRVERNSRDDRYPSAKSAPVAAVNLRDFANAMIDIALEGADADGGHIQELAIKHGLLKHEQRTERCGDACSCAEYADFPVECFRKVKELNQ